MIRSVADIEDRGRAGGRAGGGRGKKKKRQIEISGEFPPQSLDGVDALFSGDVGVSTQRQTCLSRGAGYACKSSLRTDRKINRLEETNDAEARQPNPGTLSFFFFYPPAPSFLFLIANNPTGGEPNETPRSLRFLCFFLFRRRSAGGGVRSPPPAPRLSPGLVPGIRQAVMDGLINVRDNE